MADKDNLDGVRKSALKCGSVKESALKSGGGAVMEALRNSPVQGAPAEKVQCMGPAGSPYLVVDHEMSGGAAEVSASSGSSGSLGSVSGAGSSASVVGGASLPGLAATGPTVDGAGVALAAPGLAGTVSALPDVPLLPGSGLGGGVPTGIINGGSARTGQGAANIGSSSNFAMDKILSAIQTVNTNVDARFVTLQTEFQGLRGGLSEVRVEIGKLREDIDKVQADMCTKEVFQSLEARVLKLEQGSGGSGGPQVDFLRRSLAKLDPAGRSCCFGGFKDTDVAARLACIEKFGADRGAGVQGVNVDTIYQGRAQFPG